MSDIDRGRADLVAWRETQPSNAWEADPFFQAVLRHSAPEKIDGLADGLSRFGAEVAGRLDALVQENNLHWNLPRLERFDGLGRRVEQIVHHPSYHAAGAGIYGSGVMAAFADHPNMVGVLSRFYLSSQLGEAGHNCPLACTAGVIRVLQELGDPEMKARYLPGLLDRCYGHHLEGAQFLTEVQGGSDVGANATRAEPNGDGSWAIHGEKWFCSNIDADLFLMTARIEGGGTSGLGLFLVPRNLDGGVNAFEVRRLKDKLGTRSMASGEADFVGATGWHVGEIGAGFKNMMRLVIHTSRLFNAVACIGAGRRAFVTAWTYAQHRRAFGHTIGQYPLVADHLASMESALRAALAGTFEMIAIQDAIDAGAATEAEASFQRLAVNINKMSTAIRMRELVIDAIEVLGGNGAIETFSVLPRLLRDLIVFENWEGTHNTLVMQAYRDMTRYKVHQGFFAHLAQQGGLEGPRAELEDRLIQVLGMPAIEASLALKPLLLRLSELQQASAWRRVDEHDPLLARFVRRLGLQD